MLLVDQLEKHYVSGARRQCIFDRFDLRVDTGEITALLGASGSGKTTLLNLLSGIDHPDRGRVLIDRCDIHGQGEPARTLFRRRHIGFVFQFFNLIPTLTVGENIALPMELIGMPPGLARERVDTLLEQIGLNGMADRFPDTLSGGEQQRTALARALAHRPKLILADEPTGNLDAGTGADVIALLTGLARDQGTTLLVVTHSDAVAAAADRVLLLRQGRLHEA